VARVLLTGMSGAGKITLPATLAGHRYRTVDTDYGGWELPGALCVLVTAPHDDGRAEGG
jgi:hypothetical protein